MGIPLAMEWRHRGGDISLASSISEKLEIDPLLTRILVNRGFDSTESVYDHLNPNLRQMHDPFLFRQMDRAVGRTLDALDEGKRIMIHGDYDVDGITSTALLCSFIKRSFPGADVNTFLPSRFDEGYGLSRKCITSEIEKGTDLLITVDCGIKAIETVDEAVKNGLDVIVTDHHEPGDVKPDAYSIIDPKMEDSGYPFRELAGVGVALKLAHAITMKRDTGCDIRDHLDLAALGTIADMVPMIDENRPLCYFGLQKLAGTRRTGLRALMGESGIDLSRELTSTDVSFKLAPRLNSAGRLDHPDLALDLLLTEDRVDSDLFSRELTTLNYKRQAIGKKLVEEIIREIELQGMSREPSVVLSGEGWNPGVIGVSASRIMDELGKPVIILTREGELSRGSGRSPKGFDLVEALSSMDDLFMEYGGHERAAGMTLPTSSIDDLRERFNEFIEMRYPDHVFRPVLDIDVDVTIEELGLSTLEELQRIGPFGIENPPIQVSVRDVGIGNDLKAVGSGKHLKFSVESDLSSLDCIWFGSGDAIGSIPPGTIVDITGQPDIHNWRGDSSVQLKVSDVHIH